MIYILLIILLVIVGNRTNSDPWISSFVFTAVLIGGVLFLKDTGNLVVNNFIVKSISEDNIIITSISTFLASGVSFSFSNGFSFKSALNFTIVFLISFVISFLIINQVVDFFEIEKLL